MSNVEPTPAAPPPPASPNASAVLVADRADQIAPRAAPKSPKEAIVPVEVPAPPPKKRSKAARNSLIVFLSGLFTFLTLLLLAAGGIVYAGKGEYEGAGPLGETKTVVIPARSGLNEIADLLQRSGVISNDWVFTWGARLTGQSDQLKAGEYEFRPQVSMRDVARQLSEGRVVQHSITFPEGWTSEQIVQKLIDDPVLVGKIAAIPEEGSLSPDTYKFERGRTRESLIAQMRATQEKRLADAWAKRSADLPLSSPRELLILASIVEKETAKADERPRVAGVFVNRLKRNMRLETDPTILYGLYGGKAWTESRTITRAELNAPNAYNTYKINGLPPGPIGNPGKAAIEAVANPSRTNEIFFVADGTGGHAFAETIEDHNRNVQRWRQLEAARRGAAAGADADSPVQGQAVAPAGAPAGRTPPAGQRQPGAPAGTGAAAAPPPAGAATPPATGTAPSARTPPPAAATGPQPAGPARAPAQTGSTGTQPPGATAPARPAAPPPQVPPRAN
ncbi:endolytic transglycosylase MltG [Prosthecomicrobium sp. N25]|uniref:endolytic transglycosylase MltG n=1 Tax=Prosthecomicrobium sp. N25 TaxID=3129254 RepID=UPI00307705B3